MNSRELPCLCSTMKADAPQPKHRRDRPRFHGETEGTLSHRHSHQLIDSIRKSWIPLVKHHYARTTPNWAMTNWPWMNPPIDFFPLSREHGDDKQGLLWLINLDSKWRSSQNHHTHMKSGVNNARSYWEPAAKLKQKVFQKIQHLQHYCMFDYVQFK